MTGGAVRVERRPSARRVRHGVVQYRVQRGGNERQSVCRWYSRRLQARATRSLIEVVDRQVVAGHER